MSAGTELLASVASGEALASTVSAHTLVFLRRQALQATAICCRLVLPLVGESSLADPELPLMLETLPRERPSISLGYAQGAGKKFGPEDRTTVKFVLKLAKRPLSRMMRLLDQQQKRCD